MNGRRGGEELELALNRVLRGSLPQPEYPDKLPFLVSYGATKSCSACTCPAGLRLPNGLGVSPGD